MASTDFWLADAWVFPRKPHQSVDARGNNGVERFNHTLGQRVRRLLRLTLSLPKK